MLEKILFTLTCIYLVFYSYSFINTLFGANSKGGQGAAMANMVQTLSLVYLTPILFLIILAWITYALIVKNYFYFRIAFFVFLAALGAVYFGLIRDNLKIPKRELHKTEIKQDSEL